jgi:hypothetical protein
MRAVDQQNLFVAPGGKIGQALDESLDRYVSELKQWRSKSYLKALKGVPKGLLLLNGLLERLVPQYHLFENAIELSSCPLIPLRAQWHYYSMVSTFFAARVQAQNDQGAQAIDTLGPIGEPQQQWLGNIPIPDLIYFLQQRENGAFRTKLRDLVSKLHEAPVADLSRVAFEVKEGIASLLESHNAEIRAIQEKYKPRVGSLRVQQYVTTGAIYLPTLAPALHAPGRSKGNQPAQSRHGEPPAEKGESANSLLGVLAVADEN